MVCFFCIIISLSLPSTGYHTFVYLFRDKSNETPGSRWSWRWKLKLIEVGSNLDIDNHLQLCVRHLLNQNLGPFEKQTNF